MNASLRPRRLTPLPLMLLTLLAALLLGSREASAHATLVGSDPPVDGLVLGAPDTLRLRFSEAVRPSDPAPSIAVRDADGQPVGMSDSPVGPFDDPRELVANLPSLEPGTYTVTWAVTSAVDGHALSGSFAFRVGGGLPPGVATTEDAAPAPWAVATRWASFLGAAVAAGMFLFEPLVVRGRALRWRNRTLIILGAIVLALLATLAEPVLQLMTSDAETAGTIGGVVRGLPDGWWWRPLTLFPLAALAGALAILGRDRIPAPVAYTGAALALGSLLGLVFTSHAAGRETLRWPALASNVLHQWSTALWIGGLVALVAWLSTRRDALQHRHPEPVEGSLEAAPQSSETVREGHVPLAQTSSRRGEAPGPEIDLRRFSTLALGLFTVALATGFINAGFVLPVVASVRESGLSRDALSALWTSRYGIVLLIKLAVLVVPFALAVMHRAAVRRMARGVAASAASVGGRMRATLRWEALAVAAVVLGGSTIALSAPPVAEKPVLDRITLVAPASPDGGLLSSIEPDTTLVHLTVDPAREGANRITVRLTDAMGRPAPPDPKPSISLDFLSLDHGTSRNGIDLDQDGTGSGTFATSGLDLSMNGWWRVTTRIERIGAERLIAPFHVLLPDPNTSGFDAPPAPDTDPEAKAVFQRGLASLTSWHSVRWTEYLGSGDDALVIGRFAVTDGAGAGPRAYDQEAIYGGGFAPRPDGTPPDPPEMNARRSVSVGDRGWLRTTGSAWLEQGPRHFEVPAEWGSIYAGATSIRLGSTQTINGEDAQIVTFHSPERPDQSEAWFAWWVGTETGNLLQVTMIARQHYMIWQYTDANIDPGIAPPAG